MVNLIKAQLEQLQEINRQRITWLRLSGFVAVGILIIIVDWSYFKNTTWEWAFVSVGLILSVVWWYWTMMLIRKLISQKSLETSALIDLITDIKEIKLEVIKINAKDLDNVK